MQAAQNVDGGISLDVGGTSVKSAIVAQGGIFLGDLVLDLVDSSAEAEAALLGAADLFYKQCQEVS